MAVNCCVVPLAMLAVAGVTAINATLEHVSVRPEVIPPNAAVMEVEPAATAVASPCEPAVLLMVATISFDEAQVANVVKF
jgi:hypothetical protein